MGEVNVRDKNTVNKLNRELTKFISDLRGEVSKDNNNRSTWRRKLTTSVNQRLGLKRSTNMPWPGAPNIPIQEADKQIRKAKPNFVLAVFGHNKPVNVDFGQSILEVTPELQQQRNRAEMAINSVLMNSMDLLKTITIAADNFLQNGHCIFKVIEEFNSEMVHKVIDLTDFNDDQISAFKSASKEEKVATIAALEELDPEDEDDMDVMNDILNQFKNGKEVIDYDIEKITSMPKIIVVDAEKCIVPSYTTDIGQAKRLTHEFFLTDNELLDRGLSGAYSLSKVKKAIEEKKTTNEVAREEDIVTQQKKRNEGVTNEIDSELFRVQEIYTWNATGPRGKYERWVYTILPDVADINDSTLQVIRFPYEFNEWNFVKHDNEIKDSRYHSSRGLPEMFRALQEFMEKSINNMLHRDQINNSPMYTVLTTSKIQPSSIQFIPGQRLQVNRHDEIQELSSRTGKVDLSSVQIFQILKGFLEEYIGSTDQLFRNATNAGGGKTLGEVRAGIQLSQNLVSVDLLNWNHSLQKVYTMVWNIMKERLGEPINVNGVQVTREDFQFDAIITPTGTIDSLDRIGRIQAAFNRVNLIIQQAQLGVISTEDDLYNALNDFLVQDGVKNPERYITRPEIIKQQRLQENLQQQQLLSQQEQELAQEESELLQQAASEAETVEPVRAQLQG